MDWQEIEKMRKMAETAEKYNKHLDALEIFEKNQRRLSEIEKQIDKSISQEKHLERSNRARLISQDGRTGLIFEKNHSKHELISREKERVDLINEQKLLQNSDIHDFTVRDRLEYQTARYKRIADHLQSSSWIPKDLLNAADYGALIADRSFNSLGVSERNLKIRSLGAENLETFGLGDKFKELGRTDDHLRKYETANDRIQMITSLESRTFGRSLGEPIFNLQDDLVKSRGFINDYQKAFFNHSSSLEKRLNHIRNADRRLDVAGRNWERQIKRLSETDDLLYRRNTIEAAAVWQLGTEIITDSLSRNNYLDRDPLLSHRMLEFNDEYSKFARRTINRIQNGSKIDREAYEKSLEMAEAEATIISSTISEIINASDVDLSETSSELLHTPVASNIFVLQRYELKLQGRQTDEAKELGLLEFNIINDLCFKTANCLALIAECNAAAKFIGKEEIFTPTSNMLYAGARLATIVANDREMFGMVVNFLHILLYESAGSNSLRYDEEKGGYLPISPDCQIVFAIKFLRNKFFFHEQKGTARQQEKNWNDIRDSFTRLGLPHYPTKPDEFREMQLTTIMEVEKFLKRLLSAINSKADEQFAGKSEND